MAPSSSTHSPPSVPSSDDKKKEIHVDDDWASRSELLKTGLWSTVICLCCHFYGDFTVANALPRDPRQDTWLLMYSPFPTVALCLAYVVGVTVIGPWYMAGKKPFTNLRSLLMAYNAFQVAFSAYVFYESGMGGWFGKYSFICQTCDFSDNPQSVRIMHSGYWYLFSKFIDFIDTIFFILHKKYEHLSLLHVCHHSLMPVSVWYGFRHQPGGHATFGGFLNSFVHVVMYSYYLLSAMGPKIRPYLWWKKYITTLQMAQFFVVLMHSLMLFFIECEVPRVLNYWAGGVAFLFLILFADFYLKAYKSTKSKKMVKNGSATSPSNGHANGLSKVTAPKESLAEPMIHQNGKSVTFGAPEGMSVRSRGDI